MSCNTKPIVVDEMDLNAGPYVIGRARTEGYEKGKRDTLEALGVDMTPEEAQRLRKEASAATERFEALQKTVRTFERLTGVDLGSHAFRGMLSDDAVQARAQAFRNLQQILTGDANEMILQLQRMRTHHTRVGERLASVERVLTLPQLPASAIRHPASTERPADSTIKLPPVTSDGLVINPHAD